MSLEIYNYDDRIWYPFLVQVLKIKNVSTCPIIRVRRRSSHFCKAGCNWKWKKKLHGLIVLQYTLLIAFVRPRRRPIFPIDSRLPDKISQNRILYEWIFRQRRRSHENGNTTTQELGISSWGKAEERKRKPFKEPDTAILVGRLTSAAPKICIEGRKKEKALIALCVSVATDSL